MWVCSQAAGWLLVGCMMKRPHTCLYIPAPPPTPSSGPRLLASPAEQLPAVQLDCVLRLLCCLTTKDGATPLYVASQNNHLEVIEVLLVAGANVDAADKVRA